MPSSFLVVRNLAMRIMLEFCGGNWALLKDDVSQLVNGFLLRYMLFDPRPLLTAYSSVHLILGTTAWLPL